MRGRFQDATVLVTGASRGLGRAIAAAFGGEGAHVFVGYLSHAEAAAETVGLIEKAGGSGRAVRIDVRSRESVDEAMARVTEGRGLDVLVNNAGLARDNLFALMTSEEWDQVMAVNLTGTCNCCRAAVRAMLAKKRGAIVNVSSTAGLRASPGQANYSSSKGGVIAFTRTIAAELAPKGIRVNAVVPGLFSAGMAARLDHRIARDRISRIPVGRLGNPEELAALVLFLASDEASYIVGQAIEVDGGLGL
jgi:3-oxoacyl-[acyl-carrier protein] reductase